MPGAATKEATFVIANVAFVGRMSAAGRRMCMAACRDANFFPESVVGVNAANAVVVGRGSRSVMYVRWEGNNKRMRPTWTFDAALLARGWKRKSQRLIEEALADQATPRRVVSYRWRLLDSRRK